MRTLLRLAFSAALALAGAARAEDLAEEISAARALFDDKRYVESIDRLEAAIEAVNAEIPLTVRAVTLVEETRSYGAYKPRASNVFAPDDKVRLYVEPLGYAFRRNGEAYESDLAGDFALKTPGGQTLLAQKDFARFGLSSRRRNRAYYLTLAYALGRLQPGDYVLVTTLRDLVSRKSTSFETPIKVAGPAPAGRR